MQQPASGNETTTQPKIAYHLKELDIAFDPASVQHAMPAFLDTDQDILDIGCGIGQLFAASPSLHGRRLVGIDVDGECLAYGHRRFHYIAYVNGAAECLPFKDVSFDLVVSRVSLPYTDIRRSLAEANRVLRAGGTLWVTLHSFSRTLRHFVKALQSFAMKDAVYTLYVLVNGCVFHLFGKQFPFIFAQRNESFQTTKGMNRAMKDAGFVDINVETGGQHFVCSGRKQAIV